MADVSGNWLPVGAVEFWIAPVGERALVYIKPDGLIAFWSPQAEKLTGLSREAALEVDWMQLTGHQPGRYDELVSISTKSGDPRRLRLSMQPVEGAGWAAVLEDPKSPETIHQATVRALRESEERYQFALKGASDGIWDWDLVSNRVVFSSRWKSMLGYTDQELPDHVDTWRRLVHPEDLSQAEERVHQYLSGQSDRYEAEFRMLHKEGGVRNILSRGHLVLDGAGQPARLVGTHVDLTERKQVEQALRQSQQLLQRTQELANVAGWTFSIPEGQLATSELGHSLLDRGRVHPDDVDRVRNAWQAALLGQPYEIEYRLRQGEELTWVFARASTTLDTSGNPLLITGVAQDITGQRRLEEQFLQSQKIEAIGQLAGGIAHDFNNLMTIVNGTAELLLYDCANPSQKNDILDILAAGERAAALTQQLLAFSRKQMLKPRTLQMNSVLSHFRRMLDRVLGEDICVETRLEPALWSIRADHGQIEQVLLNLVVNAREAMPTGGLLLIETSNQMVQTHPMVEIVVSDNGCGMSPEVMEKAFQPFFTTKEVGKGSGLGLSTVHGIVHQSGGSISVSSQPGLGTKFRLLFPALPRSRPMQEPALGRATVLLVEDEDGVRRVTRAFLEREGYQVLEANCGAAALDVLKTFPGQVDLLLTDVVMPGPQSGPQLASAVAQSHPQVRVLYMSGYRGEALGRYGVSDSGDHFLAKPFTVTSLLESVARLLA